LGHAIEGLRSHRGGDHRGEAQGAAFSDESPHGDDRIRDSGFRRADERTRTADLFITSELFLLDEQQLYYLGLRPVYFGLRPRSRSARSVWTLYRIPGYTGPLTTV
jgi:hypothetical protein